MDISQKAQARRDRELQAWQPGPDTGTAGGALGKGDDLTFGHGAAGNTSWDQFAANEQLFGVKTNFDEDVYTTKLDRSAADYKERERNAQRIANEIMGVCACMFVVVEFELTPHRLPQITPTLPRNET